MAAQTPQPPSYSQYQGLLPPGWLQGPFGLAWSTALGAEKDWLVAKLKAGIKARYPGLAPLDAIATIGQDRGMIQGPGVFSAIGGPPIHLGTGSGTIAFSGPLAESFSFKLIVKIVLSSGISTNGQFEYSTDGGSTYSGAINIPASLPGSVALNGVAGGTVTNVTADFQGADDLGGVFVLNDTYAATPIVEGGEALVNYILRLQNAWGAWLIAGSAWGILAQLNAAGYGTAYVYGENGYIFGPSGGTIVHTGTGTNAVSFAGVTVDPQPALVVKIHAGATQFDYSIDGGLTYAGPLYLPLTLPAEVPLDLSALGGVGSITANFYEPSPPGGTWVAGDLYTFQQNAMTPPDPVNGLPGTPPGWGTTEHDPLGTGTILFGGAPNLKGRIVIKVTNASNGSHNGDFTYSLDGGVTFAAGQRPIPPTLPGTVPLRTNVAGVDAPGAAGIYLTFVGSQNTTGTFVVNDTYANQSTVQRVAPWFAVTGDCEGVWAATTNYQLGRYITGGSDPYYWVATQSGTSGSSTPAFVPGTPYVDGTVVWTPVGYFSGPDVDPTFPTGVLGSGSGQGDPGYPTQAPETPGLPYLTFWQATTDFDPGAVVTMNGYTWSGAGGTTGGSQPAFVPGGGPYVDGTVTWTPVGALAIRPSTWQPKFWNRYVVLLDPMPPTWGQGSPGLQNPPTGASQPGVQEIAFLGALIQKFGAGGAACLGITAITNPVDRRAAWGWPLPGDGTSRYNFPSWFARAISGPLPAAFQPSPLVPQSFVEWSPGLAIPAPGGNSTQVIVPTHAPTTPPGVQPNGWWYNAAFGAGTTGWVEPDWSTADTTPGVSTIADGTFTWTFGGFFYEVNTDYYNNVVNGTWGAPRPSAATNPLPSVVTFALPSGT